MMQAANHYARKDRVPFEETLEAKQFYRMTGVKLDEVADPEKLEKAWHYVNDPTDTDRLLEVKGEIALFHARYWTKNSQAML
ncbi:MAG: hypothetical protein HWD61_06270 [Parachlamydiaceae bacterium]|nr:MAG: hypothetical protein HWD61_06270 [Parachlamydiaceae bacterium]